MTGRMHGRAHISPPRDKGIQSHQEEKDDHEGEDKRSPLMAYEQVQSTEDPIVVFIAQAIEGLPSSSSHCSIYKVSDKLRKMSIESYTPRVVAIGPFHFKTGPDMNEHKLRYMESFLRRNNIVLANLVGNIRTWERDFRNCYAESIGLDSDVLAWMMVVDGCFVVELMLRCRFPQFIDESDRIFRKPRMIDDVLHDLILLENQLPFFVLDLIFEQVRNNYSDNISTIDLIHYLIKHIVKNEECPFHSLLEHEVKHILDFARRYYLPKTKTEHQELAVVDNSLKEIPPSVTELDEAGVKFVCKTTAAANSFALDVKFQNGVLEIPKFEIDDWTETLFRNLIAFEKCHDIEKYVIQYAFLMDCFINTAKDVDLLVQSEVISCGLGNSEDGARLFNDLCKEVSLGQESFYMDVCKGLNAYCRTPWHKWKASLKRDYFKNPWIIASTIAAVVVIILTLIQTVCSILQVK